MFGFIFLVFALVLAILAAFINPIAEPWRWRFGWLAFAFLVASFLVNTPLPRMPHLH